MERLNNLLQPLKDFWNTNLDPYIWPFWRDYVMKARNVYTDRIHLLLGVSETSANWRGLGILFYCVILPLLIFIHRKICKKYEELQKDLVNEIDEIMYLLAKYQYQSHLSKQTLWGDPHFMMMREMFKTGHFQYLDNIKIIKENTKKVELIFRNQIVSDEKRNTIAKMEKKLLKKKRHKNVLGRFCSIVTVGIYRLFR